MFKQKNIKILFTTTEWDEAPFIKDQILKIIDSGISADVYKIKGKKKLILIWHRVQAMINCISAIKKYQIMMEILRL